MVNDDIARMAARAATRPLIRGRHLVVRGYGFIFRKVFGKKPAIDDLLGGMKFGQGGLVGWVQNKHGKGVPLKNLLRSGKQLKSVELEGEYKELRKFMNKYGVNFSMVKDENNNYQVFYQAKDAEVMDVAFKKARSVFENKKTFAEEKGKKPSLRKDLKKFKDLVKKRDLSKVKQVFQRLGAR